MFAVWAIEDVSLAPRSEVVQPGKGSIGADGSGEHSNMFTLYKIEPDTDPGRGEYAQTMELGLNYTGIHDGQKVAPTLSERSCAASLSVGRLVRYFTSLVKLRACQHPLQGNNQLSLLVIRSSYPYRCAQRHRSNIPQSTSLQRSRSVR